MFFSVIIPTYNPKKYLPRLLVSIAHNDCANDIEVIISDDCSTEFFDEILETFNMLDIKKIVNEKHMGFPRTGRQRGADIAQGKWIYFSDQDDYFLEHAFDKAKEYIETQNVSNCFVSDFIMESAETGERTIYEGYKGWTHGKFFEKRFWDKYELCYDEVDYCEDINLTTKVGCIMTYERLSYPILKEPLCVWYRRNDSLCCDDYFIHSMGDYVRGSMGVIIDYVEKSKDDEELYGIFSMKFINTIYHIFFYLQNHMLYGNAEALKETLDATRLYYERFKEITGLTTDAIILLTYTNWLPSYNEIRAGDCKQLPFVEHESFANWMNKNLP